MAVSTPLIIVGFLIVFPLFWMAILMVIARLGGWSGLARTYEVQEPVSGEHFKMASARLGWLASYNNCLSITVSDTGIQLRPFLMVRAGHAPLFVPWGAVSALQRSDVWLSSSLKLAIKDPDGGAPTVLTIYGASVVESVVKHAPKDLEWE